MGVVGFAAVLGFVIMVVSPSISAAEQAKMADAFVDSIGGNTHFGYYNSPYYTNINSVITALEISGIRHLRDGSTTSSSDMPTVISSISATGGHIGFDLVTETGCTINTNSVTPAENLNWAAVANIDSFEGMNELNTYGCSSPPWYTEDKNVQAALYNAVKGNSTLAAIPVVGPSLAAYSGSQINSDATSVGDCTAIINYGNQHSYPNAQMPSAGILVNLNNLTPMNGNLPEMATETGYNNDTLEHGAHNQIGVSEQAGGKYYSRLYFEYLNSGIVRTYGYELIDDSAFLNYSIDAMGGAEAHYGLLRSDGSAKPAFTAITNEIALLKDPGSAFTPGSLNFNLGSVPGYLHHTLLQRRNGTFYLALWQEVNSYNTTTFTDNVIASIPVTVQLGGTMATVNQYNPLSSPNAFASSNNVSSLAVSVGDQALILEIIPPTSGPPSAPAGLTATAGSGQVSLSWASSFAATSYNVYRSTTNGGPYTAIATNLTITSYADTWLNNGTTYYYVVTAVNSFGESSYSNQVGATPGGIVTATFDFDDSNFPLYGTNNYGNAIATVILPSSTAQAKVISGGLEPGGEMLQLTDNGGNESGEWLVPDLVSGVGQLNVSFKLLLGNPVNQASAADGLSFSWAPDATNFTSSVNKGGGTGLIVEFHTYNDIWKGPPYGIGQGIFVKWGGSASNNVVLASSLKPWLNLPPTDFTNAQNVNFSITQNGAFNLTYGTNVIFTNAFVTGYQPIAGGQMVFAASSGGQTENCWLDHVAISEGVLTLPPSPLLFTYSGNQLSLSWSNGSGILLTSTNLALPMSNWVPVVTNPTMPYNITISNGVPQMFFRAW
jgi:hypothetical protein